MTRYGPAVRLAWLSVLVGSLALAAPPKPVRKPAPPGLDARALDAFVQAVIADKAGDYDKAISRYQIAGKDLPAVVYNLADLHRRIEDPERAIELFKRYLELAPKAPDRAAVERLIAELARTPMTIVVDGDDLDAVVFIDGKPAGPSPLVTQLPDGDHVIDRIGPTTHLHDTIAAKPMKRRHLTAYREVTGNVVLSTSIIGYGGSWKDGDKQFRMGDRFSLPPGRVDTFLFRPGLACSPVSFEVPKDGLVYVFVEGPRDVKREGCTPIKVHAQKIQFPRAP